MCLLRTNLSMLITLRAFAQRLKARRNTNQPTVRAVRASAESSVYIYVHIYVAPFVCSPLRTNLGGRLCLRFVVVCWFHLCVCVFVLGPQHRGLFLGVSDGWNTIKPKQHLDTKELLRAENTHNSQELFSDFELTNIFVCLKEYSYRECFSPKYIYIYQQRNIAQSLYNMLQHKISYIVWSLIEYIHLLPLRAPAHMTHIYIRNIIILCVKWTSTQYDIYASYVHHDVQHIFLWVAPSRSFGLYNYIISYIYSFAQHILRVHCIL